MIYNYKNFLNESIEENISFDNDFIGELIRSNNSIREINNKLNSEYTGWIKIIKDENVKFTRTYKNRFYHVTNYELYKIPGYIVRPMDGYVLKINYNYFYSNGKYINIGLSIHENLRSFFKIIREEPPIITSDIDPFGEEDWNSESLKESSQIIKFEKTDLSIDNKNIERVISNNDEFRHPSHYNDNDIKLIEKNLNNNFINWIKLLPFYERFFIHVRHYNIERRHGYAFLNIVYDEIYDEIECQIKHINNHTEKRLYGINFTINKYNGPETKFREDDPYGEENWFE